MTDVSRPYSQTHYPVTWGCRYTTDSAESLRPGDYVFDIPRDRQVVSVENRLDPGMQTVVIWGDLSTTIFHPYHKLLRLGRHYIPHQTSLALTTYTRQDRLQVYVDNVVIPLLQAYRVGHGFRRLEGDSLMNYDTDLATAVIDWDWVIPQMRQRYWVSRNLDTQWRKWRKGEPPLSRIGLGAVGDGQFLAEIKLTRQPSGEPSPD